MALPSSRPPRLAPSNLIDIRVKIENKVIPEGINSSEDNPLKEFAMLTSGIIGTFIIVVIILSLLAEFLAPFVPFSWEKKIATKYQDTFSLQLPPEKSDASSQTHPQLTAYLQRLTDDIAKTQSFSEDMNVTVHYVDSDMVNAFATVGGHIIVFRGLLEKLPDENALAWVLGHEIAHIKNRDPITNLGRGVIVGIAMSITGMAIGNDMVDTALGQSGLLTILKFSRNQEEEADIQAMHSLHELYGHVGSANAFFLQIQKLIEAHNTGTIELLESHPLTENRMNKIEEISRTQGWPSNGKITPLPEAFPQWIAQCECENSKK